MRICSCELKHSQVISAEGSCWVLGDLACFSLRISWHSRKFTQSRPWRLRSALASCQCYPVTSNPCLSTTDPQTPSQEPWPYPKWKNKQTKMLIFTKGGKVEKINLDLLRWSRIHLQCRRPGFNPWVGKVPWRREWQPTPVFLPGEFHGQRILVGYSPWGHKEARLSEWHFHHRGSNFKARGSKRKG